MAGLYDGGVLSRSADLREIIGRKNILPRPLLARVGIFPTKRVWKTDIAVSTGKTRQPAVESLNSPLSYEIKYCIMLHIAIFCEPEIVWRKNYAYRS